MKSSWTINALTKPCMLRNVCNAGGWVWSSTAAASVKDARFSLSGDDDDKPTQQQRKLATR